MKILVVESGAKARTLQKYLGEGWKVVATGGHVETLPGGQAFWTNRVGQLPDPPWVWTERGEQAVEGILAEADSDTTFWLATDPDREGEFIAWCLDRILRPSGLTHRVRFHEVTEEAVRAAIEKPRSIDHGMVDSALVRKFLDRLVGFRTSRMANALVGRGASMGRVQTPTLGFVVERELEREAHVPIPYFEVRAVAQGVALQVRFHESDDPEAWRDEANKVHETRTFDSQLALATAETLTDASNVTVTGIKAGARDRKPRPPFSTDGLLQAAGSRFGWSPKKTSTLASQLYQEGHFTYIRTDSTRLAASAVQQARAVVKNTYGEDHLGPEARANVATGRTQDAHEAIRPTRVAMEDVGLEDEDASKLYRLVRAHTLASQMAPSRTATRSIEASCHGCARPLTGSVSWRTFAGWEAAYQEFLGSRRTAPPDISLVEGSVWALDPSTEEKPNPLLIDDETRPPGRYRPHSLIKAMKDGGIGRPSTYSRTIEKLEERKYVEMEEGAVAPTDRGRTIWLKAAPLYSQRSEEDDAQEVELFSTAFTAVMEERLDEIAEGGASAPETWEEWRDQIRDLHNSAREQRNAGRSTLRQQELLERLLANAPESMGIDDPASLSWQEAQDFITKLRIAGVHPAPTEAQIKYIQRPLKELGLSVEEVANLPGRGSPEAMQTSEQAGALIEELQRLHDERRPPSARQNRLIESLLGQLGVSEQKATSMVGVSSLEKPTGGRDGTASQLIDVLLDQGKGKVTDSAL